MALPYLPPLVRAGMEQQKPNGGETKAGGGGAVYGDEGVEINMVDEVRTRVLR
jgi:hypothetical protein